MEENSHLNEYREKTSISIEYLGKNPTLSENQEENPHFNRKSGGKSHFFEHSASLGRAIPTQ